mgnify:CR=1 FL=1|jgi:L,D-peptidoglycan transpeptidase YkuD (ErfK/YbiS/YcfS/YnhG family)
MHIKINKNYLIYNNYKVKCAIGKRGIGYKKKEGDLITPIGKYRVKSLLYRKDRVKTIKSKLKKITIKKNLGWCNDPKSSKYNQLINLPFSHKHEKLFKKANIYDIILVLNYNMNPIKKNKGSAIFIHVARNNYTKTEGCVAIRKTQLLKIVKQIKDSTKTLIEIQK